MMRERGLGQHDKNSAFIDYRISELKEVQDSQGLEFACLNDRVIVIANKGVWVMMGKFEDMPAEHQELFSNPILGELLASKNCIHLVSIVKDKRLGMSLTFSEPFEDGGFNATMIRCEGGGTNHRMFTVTNNELLFVVANEVSLTAKQGSMKRLRRAGVEVDKNWKNQRVRMLE